jgi:hypothetical protein
MLKSSPLHHSYASVPGLERGVCSKELIRADLDNFSLVYVSLIPNEADFFALNG